MPNGNGWRYPERCEDCGRRVRYENESNGRRKAYETDGIEHVCNGPRPRRDWQGGRPESNRRKH